MTKNFQMPEIKSIIGKTFTNDVGKVFKKLVRSF